MFIDDKRCLLSLTRHITFVWILESDSSSNILPVSLVQYGGQM